MQNTAIHSDPRTLQTVFAASQLAAVPAGSTITGLAFRLDGSDTTFPTTPLAWAQYNIQLSNSLNAPGSLSSTFADNIGPDAVTVRSGPLTIPANAFPGGSSPNPFGFEILFSTPYTYMGGNLLITIRHTGNALDTAFLDAQLNSMISQSIGAASFAGTMATPGFVTSSPIMRITFTSAAVPEPSSILLLGLGSVVLLWRGARHWRSPD